MPEDIFQFQQFSVRQDKSAMKVGTDGVLLGGWVDVSIRGRVLDIGTGTGLIALMLAQRTDCTIVGVEIDFDAAEQARENFNSSLWGTQLSCENCSIVDYALDAKEKFNYIVSNPPFFTEGARSKDTGRARARHGDSLSLLQLIEAVSKLLKENGRFDIILPYTMRRLFIEHIANADLWLCREARVKPLPKEPYHRVMFEVGKEVPDSIEIEEIIIEEGGRHNYSPSFVKYTRDFYL